jgi:hypothetical protein
MGWPNILKNALQPLSVSSCNSQNRKKMRFSSQGWLCELLSLYFAKNFPCYVFFYYF